MKIYRPEMSYIRYSTKLQDITENPKRYYLNYHFRARMIIKASHLYQNKAKRNSWNQMYEHEKFIQDIKMQIEYHLDNLNIKYKERDLIVKLYTNKTQEEILEDALGREKEDIEFDEKWEDYWKYLRDREIDDTNICINPTKEWLAQKERG